MTIDEAIKNREDCLKYLEGVGPKASPDCIAAVRWSIKALKALRPVSREQVERIRGEWMFPIFGDQQDANDPRCQCSKCGSIETPLARHRFCPSCGAPMTDEAVEMVMERFWQSFS
nr:MAG TPA: recombination protein [Caudoviricetes sp.]